MINLPPPPKGQTGLPLSAFSHLPDPPKGQQGMTLAQLRPTPPIEQSNDDSLLKKVGDFTGANAIGESLGTAAFNVGQMAQGKNPFLNPERLAGGERAPGINPASQVDIPKTIGGYIKAGSLVVGAGTTPTTLAGTIGTGAGLGAAQMGGNTLEKTGDIGKATISAVKGALLGGATAGAVYGIGHLIVSAGDKIMTSVIKPSRADMADGFNIQTVKDYQ